MTFEDAVKAKNEFRQSIKEGEFIFKTIITTKDLRDYNEYIRRYTKSDFNDDSAKEYSTDKSYIICSLWTNGKDIIKKVLKS